MNKIVKETIDDIITMFLLIIGTLMIFIGIIALFTLIL